MPQLRNVSLRQPPRLGHPDRLRRELAFPGRQVDLRRAHHDHGHVVVDLARHRVLGRLGYLLDTPVGRVRTARRSICCTSASL